MKKQITWALRSRIGRSWFAGFNAFGYHKWCKAKTGALRYDHLYEAKTARALNGGKESLVIVRLTRVK